MTASILAVGKIVQGDVHWRVAPLVTEPLVSDADVDALIDEVFAKPGLGVEDSAGLFDVIDYDGELVDLIEGRADAEYWAQGAW